MSEVTPLYLVPALIVLAFFATITAFKSTFVRVLSLGFLLVSSLLCLLAFVLKSFVMPDVLGAMFFLLNNGIGEVNVMGFKSLFLTNEFLLAMGLMGLVLIMVYCIRHRDFNRDPMMLKVVALTLMIVSFALNPALKALSMNLGTRNLAEQNHKGDFKEYYKEPEALVAPATSPNLVLIYAESLEQSYFDESLFPGLLPRLKKLKERSVDFSNLQTSMHATIGGMFSSQCGLPLLVTAAPQNMESFLPSTTCMSDLMGEIGYDMVYMGGASLEFQSKGGFYQSHGFSEVVGKAALSETLKDPKYKNYWGVYDDTLLGAAYRKFDTLTQKGSPFGLVLLTIDTHPPEGHVCKDCEGLTYEDGSNAYLNAIHCTDFLLSRFVEQIRKHPQGKDTLIVFMSDHLKNMTSDDPRCVTKLSDRKLTCFMNHPSLPEGKVIDTLGTQLDVFPTILSFYGGQDHMGLGVNLLSDPSEEAEKALIYDRVTNDGWTKDILEMICEKESAILQSID